MFELVTRIMHSPTQQEKKLKLKENVILLNACLSLRLVGPRFGSQPNGDFLDSITTSLHILCSPFFWIVAPCVPVEVYQRFRDPP